VTPCGPNLHLTGETLFIDLLFEGLVDFGCAIGPATGHADVYTAFSRIFLSKDFIAIPL
jgi:hypothetical protein